jgi:hypothetical protein
MRAIVHNVLGSGLKYSLILSFFLYGTGGQVPCPIPKPSIITASPVWDKVPVPLSLFLFHAAENSIGILSAALATLGIYFFKAAFAGVFPQLVVREIRLAFFVDAARFCFFVCHLCPSFQILTVQPDILSAFK